MYRKIHFAKCRKREWKTRLALGIYFTILLVLKYISTPKTGLHWRPLTPLLLHSRTEKQTPQLPYREAYKKMFAELPKTEIEDRDLAGKLF